MVEFKQHKLRGGVSVGATHCFIHMTVVNLGQDSEQSDVGALLGRLEAIGVDARWKRRLDGVVLLEILELVEKCCFLHRFREVADARDVEEFEIIVELDPELAVVHILAQVLALLVRGVSLF